MCCLLSDKKQKRFFPLMCDETILLDLVFVIFRQSLVLSKGYLLQASTLADNPCFDFD